jgi:hypothetical protein
MSKLNTISKYVAITVGCFVLGSYFQTKIDKNKVDQLVDMTITDTLSVVADACNNENYFKIGNDTYQCIKDKDI